MTDAARRPGSLATFWLTYAIILANVVMFGVELAFGVDVFEPTAQSVLALGANFGPVTLDGEPWRLATSLFLHFGILHIGLNMLCLYQARIIEPLFGRGAFLTIYVASGLAGSLASLLRSEPAVSAGASGAVFGVFGALAAFLLMNKERLGREVSMRQLGSIGVFIGLNFVLGLSQKGIDLHAHVGGLLAGVLVGAILAYRQPTGTRALRTVIVAIASLAATAGATLALSTGTTNSILGQPGFARPSANYQAVLRQTDEVERTSIARINQLSADVDAGKTDQNAFADVLEKEIVPTWRAQRVALEEAAASAPSATGELMHKAADYFKAREEHFAAMVPALRKGLDPADPATVRMQALATEADRLLLALSASLRHAPAREP